MPDVLDVSVPLSQTTNGSATTVTWTVIYGPDDPPTAAVPARPGPPRPFFPPIEEAACPDSETTPAAC